MVMLIGMSLPGTLLRTDATTSYMGSDLSISDGLLVYTPQASRDGDGYVGIGLSNVNAYLLSATPNLGIAGTVRIKGAVSNIENVIVTSSSTTVPVDWRNGNNQRVKFTAFVTPKFTFVPPNGTASLTLQINYPNGSSSLTPGFSWDDKVKWPGNTSPTYSTTALSSGTHFDIFYFFYEAGRGVYYGVKGVATK